MYTKEDIKKMMKNGMLMGRDLCHILGEYDHTIFHDKLYSHFQHMPNAPKRYGLVDGEYQLLQDPFMNPLIGCQQWGTGTYGFKKEDIEQLYAVFPDKKNLLDVIKTAY